MPSVLHVTVSVYDDHSFHTVLFTESFLTIQVVNWAIVSLASELVPPWICSLSYVMERGTTKDQNFLKIFKISINQYGLNLQERRA